MPWLFVPYDVLPFAAAVITAAFCSLIWWRRSGPAAIPLMAMARDRVLESMSDGVLVLDTRGLVVDLNPAARAIFGHTPSQMVGTPWGELFKDWPEVKELSAKCEAHAEVVVGTGEGQRFYEVRVWPLSDRRGISTGRVISLRDVSEWRRAQAHILEREQARHVMESARQVTAAEERLRREIAELLHGPVQTKLLAAWFRLGQCMELMDTDPGGAKLVLGQVREDLDTVREQEVRHASHLLHPSIIRIGLVPAVRSQVANFEHSFAISLEVDPRLALMDDPVRNTIPESLRLTAYRVVEEALNNVYRHARATEVVVSLGIEGEDCLSVTVKDNGVGFDVKRVKRGLGLNSIMGRVDQAGGRLEISSAEGQGTRLSILLPRSWLGPAMEEASRMV